MLPSTSTPAFELDTSSIRYLAAASKTLALTSKQMVVLVSTPNS